MLRNKAAHRLLISVCYVCMAGLFVPACSWQDTLHQAAQTPAQLRLQNDFRVDPPPRWRVAGSTRIGLLHAGTVPAAWREAAFAGLGKLYQVEQHPADLNLKILWPDSEDAPVQDKQASQRNEVTLSMTGFLSVPRPAERQHLTIHVLDASGILIHQMQLHINPKLWGEPWRSQQMLEDAFTYLAGALQGG